MRPYKKVIIIGAPRSGTNILRDVLCSFEKVSTWPCDEINYIWRYGNAKFESDELIPSMINGKISRYIYNQFDWVAKKYNADFVIEKTCANSLRVPFVNNLFPQSKFIFIERNPLDAISSIIDRWKGSINFNYLFKKAKFVPIGDIPYYSFKYSKNILDKYFSDNKQFNHWGPKINNFKEFYKNKSLEEVCSIQWLRCTFLSIDSLSLINNSRIFKIKYESLVRSPQYEISKILNFLDVAFNEESLNLACNKINSKSINKGKKNLVNEQVYKINNIIEKYKKF